MDIERNILSKVLLEENAQPLIDSKITPAFFEDEDNSVVWQFILNYKVDFGGVPTVKVVREECDDWKPFREVKEPFEFLIDRLRQQRKKKVLFDNIRSAAAAVDEDPDEAQGYLQHALALVGTELTTLQDENLTSTGEDRLKAYEELENLPNGLRGLSTGFRTIDRATSGLQPGQLVTLIGPPKAGKSTTLLAIGMAIHKGAKRPLFVGFEMSNQEQEARYDSMLAGVSFTRLTQGRLKPEEKQRLREAIKLDKSMPDFILSADISATTTIAGIDAKVEQYMPDCLIIDGVYMMETPEIQADPGSPQSLTYLSRNLKRLAQRRMIPVLATTQATEHRYNQKKGLRAKDIYGTSGFAQDSDVVLGVEPTEVDNVNRIRVVISRSGPKTYTDVTWDWDTGTFKEAYGGEHGSEEDEEDSTLAGAFD